MKISYFLALLLSGCASFTPKISPTESASATDSYIYGRLFIDAADSALAFDGHASIGLVIKCADKNIYTLRFYNSKPVIAIKVKPSTCSLKEIIFTDVDGGITGRKPYAEDSLQNMTFVSGRAYYIGDYFAKFHVDRSKYKYVWFINNKKNDYLKTTQEMKVNFPNISSLPTTDISN